MDAPAIAQAKALDSKSSSPAKSVEAALPADKTVTAKVTQVTPDQAQTNSHKVKLEINNTLLQISAKFAGKPPEPGSTVSITRSQSGQIQLTVNNDQTTAKPTQSQPSTSTTNTADNKAQNATRSLINSLSTPAPSTSASSQSVILKAPVIINASGESLAVIEKSLPKGQTLLARVIDQGTTGKQTTAPSQPILNATNSQLLTPVSAQATPLATAANSGQSQAQPQNLLNNSIIASPQPGTATSTLQAPANPTAPSAVTNTTANTQTASSNANANTPVSSQSSQTAPQTAVSQPTPSTLSVPTTTPSVSAPAIPTSPTATATNQPAVTPANQNNQAGQVAPAAQSTAPTAPVFPIARPVTSDTYSIRIVAPASPQSTAPTAPLTSTVASQTAPLTTSQLATNISPSTSAPFITPAATPTATPSAVTNTLASPTSNPSPATLSLTTPTNPSLATQSQAQNTSLANPQAPSQTTSSPTLAQSTQPASQTPAAHQSLPAQAPLVQAPSIQAPSIPAPSIQAPAIQAPAIPAPLTQNTASQNLAPQNAQLSSLANPTATIKIAVAGREVSLQAPANLPELKNVQITRVQGVQANIQWQQASPPATQPIQSLSNLTPRQVILVEQNLRQALPQQVPIAEGINQLVAQSAQLANTPGAVNSAVDKVALSIMQMFGVKPGANNSSDTIKRNVQQGGLFTEGKLLKHGAQQGDMKSFLSQLSKLADQLPAEQREMLQNTTDRMLARVTTNQLTHVQQQHVKADISNERSFQIDIPVQNNEKLDNVEMEIRQRKHLNDEGDFVSIWSVKLHFDLEERGEVDAEVALNPTDNSISTTFLCTKLSTVQEIEQRMYGFRNQLNDHGFEVQTLHCTQGSQAASANNPISKRIIDIRT